MRAGEQWRNGLRYWRSAGLLLAGLSLALGCTGCVVAGYSSGGGWFIWPGGFGLVVIVLLVLFLLRRR